MKKFLLLALGAAGIGASAAVTPVELEDLSWTHISPDGATIVSEVYGSMSIYDTKAKTSVDFFADYDGNYYSSGLGNSISNTGIVLGNTTESTHLPEYWDGIKWLSLSFPSKNEHSINMSNGITPDGARICGSIGDAAFTLEAKTMLLPAYWDRKADGTYGEPVALPHPDLDWSGRVPQYITALAISDDGKTIIGQITDYQGFIHDPIVYTQESDGSWSYTLPLHHLINPDNVEIPEWPGEGPESPDKADYMTAEELEAYNTAYQAWQAGGYVGDAPEVTDYMTEDEKAAWEAAQAAYQTALATYNQKYEAFTAVVDPLVAAAPDIVFNTVYINDEGTHMYLAVTITFEDPNSWFGYSDKTTTWDVDLVSGNITKYEAESSLFPTAVGDGFILATSGLQATPSESFIIRDGEVKPMYDYLLALEPELKDWLEAAFIHKIEIYDPATDEIGELEAKFTGIAVASRDLKVLAISVINAWNYDDNAPLTYAYVFDFSEGAVNNVSVSNNEAPVEYYNLQGVRIAEPAHGIYIRRQGTEVSKIIK